MTQVALVSDGELLQRIAAHDSAAFDELYRRFAPPVLRLALRWLRDRLRAEDATQETFAAVWRSAATYRPERGPGAPWLYAVARNAIVNQTRARIVPVAEIPESPSDRARRRRPSRTGSRCACGAPSRSSPNSSAS